MKVFVSGTTQDLGKFRDEICNKPHEWWGSQRGTPEFRCMSDAKAEAIPPVAWSMREAASADVVVLLLGRRHGALAEDPKPADVGVNLAKLHALIREAPEWQGVAEPERFSYTQWEVLAAMGSGVPVLAFTPDRRSTDEDLRSCWEDLGEADEGLAHRQECFARWVRSRTAEDHFKNRLDLLNRVRVALKRVRAKRVAVRALCVAALVAALAGLAAFAVDRERRRADRERLEKANTVELAAERLRRNLAVAVGSSLAMLGQSSARVGGAVFERSLRELGFPPNEVRALHERYATLEESVRAGKLDYQAYHDAQSKLRGAVTTQAIVLLGAWAGAYMALGHDLCRVVLILRSWDALRAGGDVASAASDALGALKASVKWVELPQDQAGAIQGMSPSDLADASRRQAALEALEAVLSRFEVEGDPRGKQEEP